MKMEGKTVSLSIFYILSSKQLIFVKQVVWVLKKARLWAKNQCKMLTLHTFCQRMGMNLVNEVPQNEST